jgi:hypothetical protein
VYEAGSSYTGSNDTRHVNGWVKKIGSTNFVFPVGNTNYERPITLTGLTASSEYNARYFQSAPPYISSAQLPIRSLDYNEHWAVTRTSGGNARVILNWDRSKVYFPPWILADVVVAGYNGTNWIDQGGPAIGDPYTTGTATSGVVTSFNYFTFGSKTWVLPLTLTSFTAKRQDNYTQINWGTASEINVKNFIVERSDDARIFYQIGQVTARNSGLAEDYSIRDHNAIREMAYYRLRSIDNDGKETVSRIVSVSVQNGNNLILLTNPVRDQIKLLATPQLNGVFQYQLLMMNGQLVQQGSLTFQNGGQYELPLKGKLTPGTYSLKMSNGQQSFDFKLMVL